MLEWLKGLDEATRALLVGVVVQYIVQALKWLGDKAGMNVAEAKLSKLVTAGVTAGVATVLVTGYNQQFWKEWLFAFASAVLLHEAGNKGLRKGKKIKKAITDAIAFESVALSLIVGLVLCCSLCAPPAHADGWQEKLSATIIAAPNDGPMLGAAVSYQALSHLWLDVGAKRDRGGTEEFAGFSTDLQAAADLIGRLFDFDPGAIPPTARAGYAVVGDFAYIGYGVSF